MPNRLAIAYPTPMQWAHNPSFLDLPYTLREDIYLILLDWVRLELVLHVNANDACPDPRNDSTDSTVCLCAARHVDNPDPDWAPIIQRLARTRLSHSSAMTVFEYMDAMREQRSRFRSIMDGSAAGPSRNGLRRSLSLPDVGNKKHNKKQPWSLSADIRRSSELVKLLRYHTLLSLLATSRRIRRELSDLYWRRTNFNVSIAYGPQSYGARPDQLRGTLGRHFFAAPIGESVQKLTFEIRIQAPKIPKKWEKHANTERLHNIVSEARSNIRLILDSFPSLHHLHLIIATTQRDRPSQGGPRPVDLLAHHGVADEILSALKNAKGLLSLRIDGPKSMNDYVSTKWNPQLDVKSPIALSNKHRDFHSPNYSCIAPVCHTRLVDYTRSGEYTKHGIDYLLVARHDFDAAGIVYRYFKKLDIPELSI